jgi:hypothetical protein
VASDKIVPLFGVNKQIAAQRPTDRDLFGRVNEVSGKIVFLDEADWKEDSLLRVMARNPIAAVIDMRRRPVFRTPNYRHRHVVSYFYRHGIQYLELSSLLREMAPGDKRVFSELAATIFNRAESGLLVFLFDDDIKKRGWIDSVRALMNSGKNHFVELHPSALAGATL